LHKTFLGKLFLLLPVAAFAQLPEPDGTGLRAGTLPSTWTTGGPKCMEAPDFQVHEYNPDFYILRESGCINYEKPFLYLLFGKDKALLLDTGAGVTEVANVVSGVVKKWLQRNGRASIPLVVTHSHNHGDHTSGDAQLRALQNVTVVDAGLESVKMFFDFKRWPQDAIEYDLGGRVIDILGIPGHDVASIALYDRETAVLLTGDTVYPGRLYVRDAPVFAASIRRLIEFTRGRPVAHVLGTHIEQTATPFVDFPIGSMFQPGEHRLELSRDTLLEIDEALTAMGAEVKRYALRDVTIYPNTPDGSTKQREVRQKTETYQQLRMWNQLEVK
jgi:glyoxylase-like metal-dependent hydrolase (beta-lactamase superfamily II)